MTAGVVGVLAEALAQHALARLRFSEGRCACGYWLDASDNPSADHIRRMHRQHVASVVAALPNIAIESDAKFHVYLHDTQERLTLLASSPNSQHEAESMAHRYLSKPGIEVDSEARVVSSVVLDSSDVADFVFRGPIPAARAAGGQG